MVVVIAGPTASGKSALGVAVAQALGGTIINADASQLYADLAIISARPDAAEEAQVPHRLYGVLDGDDAASAARWAAMARAEIAAARDAGRVPILVGGTGMYLRTLIDGIAPVPDIDPAVREAVRAMAAADVHAALAHEDPAAAARLQPADQQRTRRALEVLRSTGVALGVWQQQRVGGLEMPVRGLVLRVPRPELYARCDARFAAMVAAGAVEEARALLARGLPADRPVLKAVGVPPLAAYLAGSLTLDAAVARAQQDTRNYAKRQMTWFANQHPDWQVIGPDWQPDKQWKQQLIAD
jgi:tRNA dimethylallyltransferase